MIGLAEQMPILRFNYLHVNNNIVSKDQYDHTLCIAQESEQLERKLEV